MEKLRSNSCLPWMIGVAVLFVLYNIDSMWSWSADLAHHYSLAFRISEQWMLSPQTDPTLGEMNIYPRGSHIIAALIGAFVNSTFLGMQLATLISLSVLWLCAILILDSLPGYARTVALTAALALIVLNHFVFRFDLHGHEVVGNFFYSQLVGHAFFFLGMVFSIRIEKTNGALWASAALVPTMLFMAFIHLIPALESFGLIAGLVFVFLFTEYRNGRVSLRKIILSTAILLIAIVGMMFHPSLSAMRGIAENNGILALRNITYPLGLLAFCFFVLITSTILFVQWIKRGGDNEFLAAKYLAIYGLATAGLCALQYVLTFFGQGSDYAVKKYAFGLTTVLLLQLSVMLSMAVSGSKNVNASGKVISGTAVNTIILVILSLSVLFDNVPSTKALDVSDVVATEKRLINLVDTSLPPAHDGKPAVVIGLNGFPNTVNYLFSIAIAKTPRDLATPEVLINNYLTHPKNYSYVISSSSNKGYGSTNCKSISSGPVSLVKAECHADWLKIASSCRHPFDFSLNGFVSERLLSGFGAADSHGRWTNGTAAHFECIAGDSVFKTVKLEFAPFVHGSLNSQRLQVFVNGKEAYQGSFSAARDSNNPLVIDLSGVPVSEKYAFDFKVPDAISPKEIGLNSDRRKLGFYLKKISFY